MKSAQSWMSVGRCGKGKAVWADGICRLMALVIEKIGHLGYEVFAGGVNGEITWVKG